MTDPSFKTMMSTLYLITAVSCKQTKTGSHIFGTLVQCVEFLLVQFPDVFLTFFKFQ